MSLKEHLLVKEEDRNQNWDERFFKFLSESQLKIIADDPQQGPDGWPYLICETSDEKTNADQKIESSQKILKWLSTKGIGLVVNPKRLPYPDYVFSYGMIWSFCETGYFIKYNEMAKNLSQEVVFNKQASIKAGPPTEQYLPRYVRSVLKEFFRDQGVFDPKILMISADGENYDLCFSLESLGTPPESEHQGILEALSWFLPPHYSLAVVTEKNLPEFQSLDV